MKEPKYILWVSREGEPKIVECHQDQTPEELDALLREVGAMASRGGVLFLAPGWEVRVLG